MAASDKSTPRNFSIRGFLKLTRFWNLLIIALAQYFTAIFLIASPDNWKAYLFDVKLLLLCTSTVVLAAAGYVINDYYDVKIDFINKPERVIVGKEIKRRIVMISHTIFNLSGVAIGLYLSFTIGIINFLSALLLWFYSNQLKRMPFIGNFSVALLTGLSIYIVAILYSDHDWLVLLYAIFAFSFTLFREIIKDMEDLKGDASFGCKTLPIIWGLRKTKLFLYFLMVSFNICVFVLAFFSTYANLRLFAFLMIIPIAIAISATYRADTVKSFRKISNMYKAIMLIGILSMILI